MVSQVTGLLDSQQHTMNHERIQKGRKQQPPQLKGTPERSAGAAVAAPPRPRKTPSNDALARIARSTATQIKYISYVIAYSANQPGDDGKGGIRESARRRSGKAGVPTSRHQQQQEQEKKGAVGPATKMGKGKGKQQAKEKKQAKLDPRQGYYDDDEPLQEPSIERHEKTVADRPENQGVYKILPKGERLADKFKGQKDKEHDYPLNEDGHLREEYRLTLRARLKATNRPWDVRYIESYYWPSLCKQRNDGGIKIDNTKFFLGAVELHMAMMHDEEMRQLKERSQKDAEKKAKKEAKEVKKETDDELWRQVADTLSPQIAIGITFVKHIVGDSQKNWSLGQFLYAFDTKLKETGLDKKPMALWSRKGTEEKNKR